MIKSAKCPIKGNFTKYLLWMMFFDAELYTFDLLQKKWSLLLLCFILSPGYVQCNVTFWSPELEAHLL